MYSQGQEEKFIVEFFNGKAGTLLDIGANDGKTFSNSLRLTELGWDALLVEPSPTCQKKIIELHKDTKSIVRCVGIAIGTTTGAAIFHESGQLDDPALMGKENISLVSTLVPSEMKRWDKLDMAWNAYEVQVLCWHDFLKFIGFKNGTDTFDFISLDAEGVDIDILEQMDLNEIGVKLICIEWNSIPEIKERILKHTSKFGMDNIIYQSGENLLICRKQ